MATKLTLSVDEHVVAEAKAYAKDAGKSLSKIVEGYLRGLRNRKKNHGRNDEMPLVLKRLAGCMKIPGDAGYTEAFTNSVHEKYQQG